ncbi:C-GCAxxG-C-C family protein [Candidatus Parcubacteria bacterium]|nr:C-GCAxxG-C-C family protein [Candidatus Parcubacteria bacterium]
MNIAQKAKENFLNGLSCSEAVVKTVKDDESMIKIPDEVLRIASAFKAGIGCKGDVCGALLGAI